MSELLVNEISKYDASQVTVIDDLDVGKSGAVKNLDVWGNTLLQGTLEVDGTAQFDGAVNVNGTTHFNHATGVYFGSGTSYKVTNTGAATLLSASVAGKEVLASKAVGAVRYTFTAAASSGIISSLAVDLAFSSYTTGSAYTISTATTSGNRLTLQLSKGGVAITANTFAMPTVYSADGDTRISAISHSSGITTITFANASGSTDDTTLDVLFWTET